MPRRARIDGGWRDILPLLVLSLAIAAALAVLVLKPDLRALADRAAVSAGFAVTRMELSGNRFASEKAIRDAVALEGETSHLVLDIESMARRIEALPWVRSAVVSRILPYAVSIRITERVPAAVWRASDGDVLIDAEGRVLAGVPTGADTGLAVVRGEGAGPAAPTILPMLAEHPRLASRVREVERIAGRRWDLLLDRRTRVMLPGDGLAAALAWLENEVESGLLSRDFAVVDLRVPGNLVVRNASPAERPR